MLSYLGVKQHVKTEWRRLPREFGGIGLYNLSIEQFISWMEVLLQHYGTGFTTSKNLQASLEAMQSELGCSGNPLNEDYSTLGPLAMEGWFKTVWECASHYGYNISLNYPTERLPLPREGNCNLVMIFLERGKLGKELVSLNQCRTSHQAKHLSCISTAEWNHLDPVYLSPPLTKERLSFNCFAQE
jgi:hypothetical protein